jgi:hypothetical protein
VQGFQVSLPFGRVEAAASFLGALRSIAGRAPAPSPSPGAPA